MNYDLERFLKAQKYDYEQALSEIKSGSKQSHWIWYIFPQLKGLGHSETAQYYGIENLAEAKAYMQHPILHQRLLEISGALLNLQTNDALAVMGCPDNLKLKSSMTLFALAAPDCSVFEQVLAKFYNGEQDGSTIRLLRQNGEII